MQQLTPEQRQAAINVARNAVATVADAARANQPRSFMERAGDVIGWIFSRDSTATPQELYRGHMEERQARGEALTSDQRSLADLPLPDSAPSTPASHAPRGGTRSPR